MCVAEGSYQLLKKEDELTMKRLARRGSFSASTLVEKAMIARSMAMGLNQWSQLKPRGIVIDMALSIALPTT